jgi:hypothetical protein
MKTLKGAEARIGAWRKSMFVRWRSLFPPGEWRNAGQGATLLLLRQAQHKAGPSFLSYPFASCVKNPSVWLRANCVEF